MKRMKEYDEETMKIKNWYTQQNNKAQEVFINET